MQMERKLLTIMIAITMMIGLTACASSPNEQKPVNTAKPSSETKASAAEISAKAAPSDSETKRIKIKVTVGESTLTATLIDNATTRSLIAKFPLTVPMTNLYTREMVYRFPDPLPANEPQTSGYEVGDISYWTPRHSFVIFYEQNGEVISNLQKIGRFDGNVEGFKHIKDANVTFELVEQ